MKYAGALQKCPLFSDLNEAEMLRELKKYDARYAAYAKGETLLKLQDSVDRFALVLSGAVQVMQDDVNGQHMIMITVEPGQTFAESLCFRGVRRSPVYACALSNCEVCWLSAAHLQQGPQARFLNMLTGKTLAMNDRIQVLSKHTLREKLMTLFSMYAAQSGNSFRLPFDRESLAAYLGANRSAVSREMSRMQAEGLITFQRDRITLTVPQQPDKINK